MNVNYSDSVTDTIRTLRENVYNTEKFKLEFAEGLEKSVGATDVTYIPEQFGGWSVNVTTDKDKSNELGIAQESSSYLSKISDTLTSSIRNVDRTVSYSGISPMNLTNVIVTGENSITVKL